MSYMICCDCGAFVDSKAGEGDFVLKNGRDVFRCGPCCDSWYEGMRCEYEEMRQEERRFDLHVDDPRHTPRGR